MAPPITVVGDPLTPLSGDRVVLVEGTIGNTVPEHHSIVQNGDVFYLTFAAEKGKTAQEVAQILKDKYQLKVRHWIPLSQERPANAPTFDLNVRTAHAHHYLDEAVRDKLRYMPDTQHLAFKFGQNADYYVIGLQFDPRDYDKIFATYPREGRDEKDEPTGYSRDTLKFDILQFQKSDDVLLNSAGEYAAGYREGRLAEVIHLGGLVLYDRTDSDDKPQDVYVAWFSDNHFALLHDDRELAIMGLDLDGGGKVVPAETPLLSRQESERAWLTFNNPNDVLEAEVAHLKKLERAGQLDITVFSGDAKDWNAIDYDLPESLRDSNALPLASQLAEVPGAVYIIRGNHDSLRSPTPAGILAGSYQTDKGVLDKVKEGERSQDMVTWLTDTVRSLEDDPRGLFPDYDLFNRFRNIRINWRGENNKTGEIRDLSMLGLDTQETDVAHLWPNDPFYDRFMQGYWFGPDWVEWVTAVRFVRHKSPDVLGLEPADSAWAAAQDADFWFGHGPYANGKDEQREFNPASQDPKRLKVTRAVHAGQDDANRLGAIRHDRDGFVAAFHASERTKLYGSGHQHTFGNEYVTAKNKDGVIEKFKLSFLIVMKQIVDDHEREKDDDRTAEGQPFDFESSLASLWKPTRESLADPSVHPAVKALYGNLVLTHHDIKVHLQLGASGVGTNPVFALMAYTPKGNLYLKPFYPVKCLRPHPDDPTGKRYVVVYEISDMPRGSNRRLVEEWERLKKEDPKRWLDRKPTAERIAKRRTLDTSLVPSADSLKPLPEVQRVADDIIIDPVELYNYVRLYYLGNHFPEVGGSSFGFDLELDAGMLHTLDPKFRALLLKGFSTGWRVDDHNTHRLHFAYNFPDYIKGIFYKRAPNRYFIVRGLNPRMGLALHFPEPKEDESRYSTSNADAKFYFSWKVLEVLYHRYPFEFSLGLLHDLTGPDQWLYMGGFSLAY